MKKKLLSYFPGREAITKLVNIMKISTFLIFICAFSVSASIPLKAQKLTLNMENATIRQIFDEIEKQSGYKFFYIDEQVDVNRTVKLVLNDSPVEEALSELFDKTEIKYKVFDKKLVVLSPNAAQQSRVTGTVTDATTGEALAGVNVRIQGTTTGTITDIEGKYSIEVAGSDKTLVFSFIGYLSESVPINEQSIINVMLKLDVQALEEVVVVGYGIQKKVNLTGSVSAVNANDIKDVPVNNLSNALAGKLSGVTITQRAGTPGMESDIRIRAIGTTNNSNPLYVIDGIVQDKFAFDGLTPDEVENISILKDGASASVYGSRAANGVILVTTKRGSKEAPTLTYTSTFGIQTPTRIPEALNAFEQATLINDGLAYQKYYNQDFVVPESDAYLYTQDELDYFKTHSWNWVEELWRTPINTQHTLNVSGGTDNIKYFIGGSYLYATGSFDGLDYRKLNLRGNMDVDITKNLTVSLDLSTDDRVTRGPSWDVGNWRQEDLYKALVLRSNMVPPTIDGLAVGNWVEWSPVPIINKTAGYNNKEWNGLNATIALNYKVPFIDGLGLNVKYNRFQRSQYSKQFNLPYNMTLFNTTGTHNHIVGDTPVGLRPRAATEFLLSRDDRDKSYQFNIQLNYNRSFGDHNVDAFLVYEQTESDILWFQAQRNNFISTTVDQYIAGGASVADQLANGSEQEDARLSYVGSVSYNYKQTYLLQTTFRYDGSVIFAPENRWGFFPSVSFGWRVSNEPFFNIGFIDDLKFRGSVALVGNDAVGSFQWLQSFSIDPGASFNGLTPGLQPGVIANRNITWEKTLSYNGGFDSRFWNNKMSLNLDLFYRHTYDILERKVRSTPDTYGGNLPDENYAIINAKGFEVELGYNSASGSRSDQINFYVKGNFGFATNEIVKYDEAQNIRPYQSKIGRPIGLADNGNIDLTRNDMLFGYMATDIIRTQEDLEDLPSGYTIIGTAPLLGMLNYVDNRGTIGVDTADNRITSDDMEYLGKYSIPPINYGLSLGLSWKSFTVDALFQGVAGHYIMLHANARRVQGRAEESTYRFWADHWTSINTDAAYPAARRFGWPPTDYPVSDWFMRSGSFVRFKSLNVSYELPKTITGRLKSKSIKVFYAGTNLLLLYDKLGDWGYDPEVNNIRAYPMMATHSFGLNIIL